MNIQEILDDLNTLCDYAYKQGFHELGYDPVAEIEKRYKKLQSEVEFYRTILDCA